MRESQSLKLAHLKKKEEEEEEEEIWAVWQLCGSSLLAIRSLVGHENVRKGVLSMVKINYE